MTILLATIGLLAGLAFTHHRMYRWGKKSCEGIIKPLQGDIKAKDEYIKELETDKKLLEEELNNSSSIDTELQDHTF